MLSWKENESLITDYLSNNKELLKADQLSKYMKKINKSDVWKSEAHDCYRSFIYNPSKENPSKKEAIMPGKRKIKIESLIYFLKKNLIKR